MKLNESKKYVDSGTIQFIKFYNNKKQRSSIPFLFPVTILYNSGDGYKQTVARVFFKSIKIINVTEKELTGLLLGAEDFDETPATSFEIDLKFNPENFIFDLGNNIIAHGYKNLVKVLQKKRPELDFKPDPIWDNPIELRAHIGGSLEYDYFFHVAGLFNIDIIKNDNELKSELNGLYTCKIGEDLQNILWKKYKEPVIKNGGPLRKRNSGNVRYVELGRRVHENNSTWSDIISDTYTNNNK